MPLEEEESSQDIIVEHSYEQSEPLEEAPEVNDDEFMNEANAELQPIDDFVEEAVPPQVEGLTEDDLDFIENINSADDNELSNESVVEGSEDMEQHDTSEVDEIPDAEQFIQEAPQKTSNDADVIDAISSIDEVPTENVLDEEQPPVVPIYPVEETPISGPVEVYQPGDRVTHPKYGEGSVEKMVKFGNKILCSINFANGRRLLDPTVSQLSKI